MKNLIVILFLATLMSCNLETPSQQSSSKSPTDYVEVLSHSKKVHGNGIFVYVEIKNTSNKTMKFVGAEISYYDSNGGILESGVGTTTDVAPGSTAVIDRYFDPKPAGAMYKIRIKKVTF